MLRLQEPWTHYLFLQKQEQSLMILKRTWETQPARKIENTVPSSLKIMQGKTGMDGK